MAVKADYTDYSVLGVDAGQYTKGFPFINNHLHFVISYHTEQLTGLSRVVGLKAVPASIKYSCAADASTSGQTKSGAAQLSTSPELVASQGADVTFSYSMEYKVSEAGRFCASFVSKDWSYCADLKQFNNIAHGANKNLAIANLVVTSVIQPSQITYASC